LAPGGFVVPLFLLVIHSQGLPSIKIIVLFLKVKENYFISTILIVKGTFDPFFPIKIKHRIKEDEVIERGKIWSK